MNGTLRGLYTWTVLLLVLLLLSFSYGPSGAMAASSLHSEATDHISTRQPCTGHHAGLAAATACDLRLFPGDRVDLHHIIHLPELPPGAVFGPVDILYLQDESWRHDTFVAALKNQSGTFFDAVREAIPDSRLGVAGFRDFPVAPWGMAGDWPFRLVQDLSFDRNDFLSGMDGLCTGEGGGTEAGSHYEALSRSIKEPSWRPEALRIVVLATRNAFHTGCEESYPGPCGQEVIGSLQSAGVLVHGLHWAESHVPQLVEVASSTGGLVTAWSWDGTGFAFIDSLLEAMAAYMPWRVEPEISEDTGIEVVCGPASWLGPGDRPVAFAGSVLVLEGTAAGPYQFEVEFRGYYRLEAGGEVSVLLDVLQSEVAVFDRFDWITMVYLSERDADEAVHIVANIGEAACYGTVRTVVAVAPGLEAGYGFRLLVSGPHGLQEVEDMPAFVPGCGGEVDVAGPGTLAGFISWAMDRFPAERYALLVRGAACGWGTCCGENGGRPVLGIEELGLALDMGLQDKDIGFEVIGLDGGLINTVEIACRLRDSARYLVAAAGPESSGVWPYGCVLSRLADHPGTDGEGYAGLMLEEYAAAYAGTAGAGLSAVDLAEMSSLVGAVDRLALALMEGMDVHERELALARSLAGGGHGCIDLYRFTTLLSYLVSDTAVQEAVTEVMALIDNLARTSWTGVPVDHVKGLAIYYPDFEDSPGDLSSPRSFFYAPAYDERVPVLMSNWPRYLKRAPRFVGEGAFAAYVPGVLLMANAVCQTVLRFDWPDITGEVEGFAIARPVSVTATPEGSIDAGMTALLYTRGDLQRAGFVKSQIVGQAYCTAEGKWRLLKLTMDLPEWNRDLTELAARTLPAGGGFPALLDTVDTRLSTLEHYDGAVIAVPWFERADFENGAHGAVTTLGIVAAGDVDYLTPIQYPQKLYEGWNLMSVPVIPFSDLNTIIHGYGGLLPGIASELEVIWSYDAAAGKWRAFSPAAPAASDLWRLKDGQGYWVRMRSDATLTVLGSNMLLGPHVPPVYELVEGWNLIGYKGILPVPVSDTEARGYLEGVSYWHLQGCDRFTGEQLSVEVMQPNEGYWIYASRAGKVTGTIEDSWVQVLAGEADGWVGAVENWVHLWAARDPELGARLAWNVVWYSVWVIGAVADARPLKDWGGLL